MASRDGNVPRLMFSILGLTLLGGALFAYLWETLNRLLSGQFEPTRILVSVPILIAFALLLRFMARVIQSWHSA